MGSITEHQGNVFDSGVPALAHGCNIRGVMGAGIAVQFKQRWPEMYTQYRRRCRAGRFRLGEVMIWADPSSGTTIYNMATQQNPGADATTKAIEVSIQTVIKDVMMTQYGDAVVAMPRIGCGLGGLQWVDVECVLAKVIAPHPVQLQVWSR